MNKQKTIFTLEADIWRDEDGLFYYKLELNGEEIVYGQADSEHEATEEIRLAIENEVLK